MRSGSTELSLLDSTRTFNDVNRHPTLIHQYPTFGFDSIPLIIEVVGIITTVATCLLMHFILKKSYEDTDRPTFHHLIHDQYYSKQLDEFLNDRDGKNETVIIPTEFSIFMNESNMIVGVYTFK
ncbi:hypothetical protein ACH3XW_9650 [Acanthocheilonema viteae]